MHFSVAPLHRLSTPFYLLYDGMERRYAENLICDSIVKDHYMVILCEYINTNTVLCSVRAQWLPLFHILCCIIFAYIHSEWVSDATNPLRVSSHRHLDSKLIRIFSAQIEQKLRTLYLWPTENLKFKSNTYGFCFRFLLIWIWSLIQLI